MSRRKYYATKAAANKARQQRIAEGEYGINVYRMPKGSRHAGQFAVCSYVEYLNTY